MILATLSVVHLAAEIGTKSPLNPILGETLVQESANGTRVYCEQTSHHPPISNFLIEGSAECPFRIYGHVEYKVEVRGAFSRVDVSMPGKVTLELPDKTIYETEYPMSEVNGLMSDVKIFTPIGEIKLRDLTNDYELKVTFDAKKDRRSTGFLGLFKSTPLRMKTGATEHRRDLVEI